MRYLALLLLLLPLSAGAITCNPVVKGDVWGVQVRLGELGYFKHEPTGYFGKITKAAVVAFQKDNGLEQVGLVGPKTRALLNECKAGPGAVLGTSTAPVMGLTASAGDQPAFTLAPANALSVPFTNITLTAGDTDVHITKIVVERVGPSHNSAFYDIVLLSDLGVDIGYLNNTHRANIRTDYTIPANTSVTILVAGDMNYDLSGNDGTLAALRVVEIESSAPVSGLPITGTFQTINASLIIGSAYTSVSTMDDPLVDRTQYVQDKNVRLAGVRIQAGSVEGFTLNSITFRQNGSASESDVQNVSVVINGIHYPTTVDGRSYTAIIDPMISLGKGEDVLVGLIGDIGTTGSNRTLKFDIDDGADIELYGTQYGFGIFPIPEGNTAVSGSSVFLTEDGTTDTGSISPYYSASTITISPGAFTGISK